MTKKVRVFTHIPSPYQVELFDAVAESGNLALEVCYLHSKNPNRLWGSRELRHEHIILNDDAEQYAAVEQSLNRFDLVVFHYYQNPRLLKLIKRREQSGQPWCFWGERPGYRRLGWLGVFYRRLIFSVLHQSNAPIWGMGKWAVEQYRKEYGKKRLYCNVPYFSDLARFKRTGNGFRPHPPQRSFLYSGSLIYRKGVDLLAQAFSRLADELPNVSLRFVGDGQLRPSLEKKLTRYGSRVEFAGFQAWESLPDFYKSSDFLCVPSRYDGWNLVVPEGLAAGLPVIGTNRTGAALELITQRENGWLIPSEDVEALYQSMREAALLSQASLLERSAVAEMSVQRHTIADGVSRFHQAVDATLRSFQRD
jgi:glycosyltransferase involved in cell wall biosynthesis